VLLPCRRASAQNSDGFIEPPRAVVAPYAGKYEARIGVTDQPAEHHLRLDIGASVDLLSLKSVTYPPGDPNVTDDKLQIGDIARTTFGADFFTWTQLRSVGNFKFPVEAVDYYFGINAARHYEKSLLSDLRLRVAHISAHLVDGDPSFTDPEQKYMTYSREFVDAMAGFDLERLTGSGVEGPIQSRLDAGALWLFHTIPDTLGRLTPYVGGDMNWRLLEESFPVTLRAGLEARLNTELEPIGEFLGRVGVKLGTPTSRGVTIEGSYYSGHSPYGQRFTTREKYFALGFLVDL
jgi:hypothetical protein